MEQHDTLYLDNKYGDKIQHRIKEYQGALEVFCRYKNEGLGGNTVVGYADGQAGLMAYLCYGWHHKFITEYIRGLSNEYKIASLTELVINYSQPLQVLSGQQVNLRKLNAEFGVFAAVNIIEYMRDDAVDPAKFTQYASLGGGFDGGCEAFNTTMEQKLKVHGIYMASLNLRQPPPVVSNSFVWELFHFFYRVRWQAIAV